MTKPAPTIRTPLGRTINLLNPDFPPPEVLALEIARGLSREFRYGGNAYPYSVGQHSYIVSECLPQSLRLAGAIHDASEAYLRDMQKPFKRLLRDYQKFERLFQDRIARAFGVSQKEMKAPLLHQVDRVLFKCEITELVPLRKLGYSVPEEKFPENLEAAARCQLHTIWEVHESEDSLRRQILFWYGKKTA